jgi:hypothetical protein
MAARNMYSIRGRTAATAATAGHALCSIWNPHATKRITVHEMGVFKQGAVGAAGDTLQVVRISARGTAGSTVTPTISNDHNRDIAPPSGFLLDLAAYTVQPTLDGLGFRGIPFANVQGAGFILPFNDEVTVLPGAGLAWVQVAATAFPISEVWAQVSG